MSDSSTMAGTDTEVRYCDCACLGCESFHGVDVEEGQDAHHARLLLALDRSIAAACRSRGIAACDGIDDKAPCEIGTLHTRAGELAGALAAMLEDPAHVSRVESAVLTLAAQLRIEFVGKPKLS